LDNINFLKGQKRRKNGILTVSMLVTAIVVSMAFAGIMGDEGNTDTSQITIEFENKASNETYTKVISDYSGNIKKNYSLVEQTTFTSGVDDVFGIPIGDKDDTRISDGKYFSLISQESTRESWDVFDYTASELEDYNGFSSNTSIRKAGYVDGEGIINTDVVSSGETKELFQIYSIRGASLELFDINPNGWESYEDSEQNVNFHATGAYPSYFTQLNFSVRLQFANLGDPTSASPLSYTVSFFNYLTQNWDAIRVENTSLLDTYANGLYQTDPINLNRENVNFPAYFDPTDRLTMLIRIGLEYTFRSPTGIQQEINVDSIHYTWEAKSYEISFDFVSESPNIPEEKWRKNPSMIIECKSNSSTVFSDNVVLIGSSELWKGIGFEKVPIGIFDEGLVMNTTLGQTALYNSETVPIMDVYVYSANPLKMDFDSIIHIAYPEKNVTLPNRWYINDTNFDEVVWEFNITTNPIENDGLIKLNDDYEVFSVITPFGDDATDIFTFEGDIEISTSITDVFGHGIYQIFVKSPNYITFASITDTNYNPISEVSYGSPVNHKAELFNFDTLLSEGKIGQVNVTFVTESGGSVYYNTTEQEFPDSFRQIMKGSTSFTGASVGVVDCEWIWYNGEELGYFINQFVMRGFSTDGPFIKIFNPEELQRVSGEIEDNDVLFVAVVASIPEEIEYSIDFGNEVGLTKGFIEGFRGISALLQDFTYYSALPIENYEHETLHDILVSAIDGVNDLQTQQSVSIEIDTQVLVAIDDISEAYDDVPTTVTFTSDDDVNFMNIILDSNRIGSLEGDQIGNEFRIPRLSSGTYFLDIQVRDDVGNWDEVSASFFVNQRNPTPIGTILQYISDFFKILGVFILSFIGIGIAFHIRKKDRIDCPFGECEVNFN